MGGAKGGARLDKGRTRAGAREGLLLLLTSRWELVHESVLRALCSVLKTGLFSVLGGLSARCLLLLLPLLVVVLFFFFFLAFLTGPCGGTDGETRQQRW